jgi:catechol 2,3-dioxygenase-like lactoylglutathione lyase family enzyme
LDLVSAGVTAFLAAVRPDEARRFYRDVLGLPLEVDDEFALVFGLRDGAVLRVARVEAFQPHAFTSFGWRVADVRGAVTELRSRGVVLERFPGMGQDDLGVWTPPGATAGVAWFKDPDGNLLSVSGPLEPAGR